VDYVFSKGESDDSEFGTVLVASLVEGEIELNKSQFAAVERVFFPVMGQVTQPGRAFYASANRVEVRLVFNDKDIAFQVIWHDMSPQKDHSNAPDLEAPVFLPGVMPKKTDKKFSDAVVLQFPLERTKGPQKPYFIFGEKGKPVDLWFSDLAKSSQAQVYVAEGAKNIKKANGNIGFKAEFAEGQWVAYFKGSRKKENVEHFEDNSFTPIAFSFWDGFNKERGNKRGLTEWFHVYLKSEKDGGTLLLVGKMIIFGYLVFLLESLGVLFVRTKFGKAK